MRIKDWIVAKEKDKNYRQHFYGYSNLAEYSEEEKEDFSNYEEIPRDRWTIDDCVEITSNLLEDVNKHSECSNPRLIVTLMKESGISEDNILIFIWKKCLKNMVIN